MYARVADFVFSQDSVGPGGAGGQSTESEEVQQDAAPAELTLHGETGPPPGPARCECGLSIGLQSSDIIISV